MTKYNIARNIHKKDRLSLVALEATSPATLAPIAVKILFFKKRLQRKAGKSYKKGRKLGVCNN